MRCVNSRVCFSEATREIRDPYFEEIHELAYMPVCDKCCAEYLALDPSLGYFERPEMIDTQIQTADITLRFSDRASATHEPFVNPLGFWRKFHQKWPMFYYDAA